MKRIGITQRLVACAEYPEIRDALDIRWGECLEKLGWIMVPIPSGMEAVNFLDHMQVDGIILSGGNDLSSVAPNDPLSKQRDDFEETILEYALTLKLPVMGVCRGMQLIASYFGGALKQIEGHAQTCHRLITTPVNHHLTPRLQALAPVDSFHNYGISSVPNDFVTLALSEDGQVEAMIHKSLPVYVQMWHPERDQSSACLDIIRAFFMAEWADKPASKSSDRKNFVNP